MNQYTVQVDTPGASVKLAFWARDVTGAFRAFSDLAERDNLWADRYAVSVLPTIH